MRVENATRRDVLPLYDAGQDGPLEEGEVIYVHEDGRRERGVLGEQRAKGGDLGAEAKRSQKGAAGQAEQSHTEEWGEVLFFDRAGHCRGIAPDGSTVYCGETSVVKEALANPGRRTGDEVVDGILELERQLITRRENESGRATDVKARAVGRQRVVRTRGFRVGPTSNPKHKPLNTRYHAPRKGLSVRQAQPNRAGLHRE